MNSKLEKKDNNIEKSFLSIFITTFTTIFIAELGDKTQIATLMLSAESGKPIIVFLGSSLALISSSVVGVLIGKWLSKKISPSKLAKTRAKEDPKKTANGLLEVPLIVNVANCVLSPNSAIKTVKNVDSNKLKTIYK